ncbi:MAG: EamA family transporter [Elusimicrobia bacterium]|nr:EamA family transporter [Elusimicrobiota bacterium]
MVPILLYLLLCLIWGSTWSVIRIGLVGVPPFLAAGLRFLLSATILFAIVYFKRISLRFSKEDKVAIFSAGILGFTGGYAFVYWAEQYISGGLTAILFSSMPLIVACLSHFWVKTERLTTRKVLGILIGMAGTAILFWTDEQLSAQKIAAMGSVLLASFCAATNLVTMKKYSHKTNIYILNACAMSIAAACLLSLSFFTESYREVTWSLSNLTAMIYLAVFGTVIAFICYYTLLHKMPATRLSTLTLSFPIIAVWIGWLFLNESVSGKTLLGIVTVLAGVSLVILSPSFKKIPEGVQYEG